MVSQQFNHLVDVFIKDSCIWKKTLTIDAQVKEDTRIDLSTDTLIYYTESVQKWNICYENHNKMYIIF